MVRDLFIPSFLRCSSDESLYDTSKYVEHTKLPMTFCKRIQSQEKQNSDDESEEMDDEVEANTLANSMTNVSQYKNIPVNGDEIPASTKGKSSLAIAAAATSIMFSAATANQVRLLRKMLYCRSASYKLCNFTFRVLMNSVYKNFFIPSQRLNSPNDGRSKVTFGDGCKTSIDEGLELVQHRDLMARTIQQYLVPEPIW